MIMKNKIVYDTSFIIRLFEKPLNISEPSTLLDGNSLILTNVIHELSHLSRKSTPKKKKIINSAISYHSWRFDICRGQCIIWPWTRSESCVYGLV